MLEILLNKRGKKTTLFILIVVSFILITAGVILLQSL